MATRAKSLRALIVLAAALVVLAALADLTRGDSFLRSAWRRVRGSQETPAERLIHDVQDARGAPKDISR